MKLTEKRLLVLLWGAVVAALAVFALPLFVGRIYTHNDLGTYHLPLRWFYQNCLLSGDSPNWIPQLFNGMYLQGEGQVGIYHPLHYLLYRFLPLQLAFNLELLWSYPFMLAGLYLFLRRWELPRAAALFGAFVFMFSGFNTLRSVHMHVVEVTAHMPWLLVCVDIALRNPRSSRAIVALAGVTFLTASQLLLGFPQSVYFSALVEALYAIFLAFRLRQGLSLIHLAVANVLAVLIAGIQLLPTYEFLQDSVRAHYGGTFRYYLSLHPLNLLQLLGPSYFRNGAYGGTQHEFGLYTGAAATLLTLWTVFRLPRLKEYRALGYGAAALSAIALVLALGSYGGLYRFVAELPLLGSFKAPCRHIVLVHFGIAILAAIAFADLMRTTIAPPRTTLLLGLPVLLAWACAGLVLGGRAWLTAHFSNLAADIANPSLVLIGPTLIAIAAILIWLSARGKILALILLFLFAVADQSLYGLQFLWYWNTPSSISAFLDRLPLPPDAQGGRIQGSVWPAMNTWIMKGYSLTGGCAGLPPATMLAPGDETTLRLAATKWLERPGSVLPLRKDPRNLENRWIRIPAPMPRVRLVNHAKVSDDPASAIRDIDITSAVVVDKSFALDPDAQGSARILDDKPGRVLVQTDTSGPMLLVLSESYHEGWRLTIDTNITAKPVRAYGDFMGVPVQAGSHTLDFQFSPWSFLLGKRLTSIGVGLAVLYFVGLGWYLRRETLRIKERPVGVPRRPILTPGRHRPESALLGADPSDERVPGP